MSFETEYLFTDIFNASDSDFIWVLIKKFPEMMKQFEEVYIKYLDKTYLMFQLMKEQPTKFNVEEVGYAKT